MRWYNCWNQELLIWNVYYTLSIFYLPWTEFVLNCFIFFCSFLNFFWNLFRFFGSSWVSSKQILQHMEKKIFMIDCSRVSSKIKSFPYKSINCTVCVCFFDDIVFIYFWIYRQHLMNIKSRQLCYNTPFQHLLPPSARYLAMELVRLNYAWKMNGCKSEWLWYRI